MPLPHCTEFVASEEAVEVEIGPFTLWFSGPWPGILIAFKHHDGYVVCRNFAGEDDDEHECRDALRHVPGSRLAPMLPSGEFEDAWNKLSDPYLYPKRVGKLRQDWPGLAEDVPLDILADWLQDHGCEGAAKVLRDHKLAVDKQMKDVLR